jgi:hypothetical protein
VKANRRFGETEELMYDEVLIAVVTNAVIFWDIAQSSLYVNRRFGETANVMYDEILIAIVTNAAIFWDIAQRSLYVNRRFVGMYHFHHQDRNSV